MLNIGLLLRSATGVLLQSGVLNIDLYPGDCMRSRLKLVKSALKGSVQWCSERAVACSGLLLCYKTSSNPADSALAL